MDKNITIVSLLREYRDECYRLKDCYIDGLLSEDEFHSALDRVILRSGQQLFHYGKVREMDGKIKAMHKIIR